MKNKVLLFVILSIIVFPSVIGTMPIPKPTCHIEGVISNVEFQKERYASCLDEEGGCPTDMPIYFPEGYNLDIKILNVSYVFGESVLTCEEIMPIGSSSRIFLSSDKVDDKDNIRKGALITGEVSSAWGSNFDNYEAELILNDEGIDFPIDYARLFSFIGIPLIILIVAIVLSVRYVKEKRKNRSNQEK